MTTQQGAPEAPSYEHQRAIMEGERNASLRIYIENANGYSSPRSERAYETGFTNGWNRLAALVEAQQPAPSAAAAEAVVVYEQKENEMQVWFRPARMHGHPERTPIKATITKDRGNGIVDLTYDDGEFSGNARAVPNALRLPRNVREQVAVWWDVGFEMDFQTAVDNSLKKKKDDPPPHPSPTPQADSAQDEPLQAFDSPRAKALMRAWEEGWAACRDAEYVGEEAQNDAFNSSHTLTLCIAEDQQLPAPQADIQPVPQGETNVQLDTDSNHSAPGQQRDVAGSVALGQPVGNGSDQAAGHTGAQGDKLLIVAERNIRSFLRSAVFKSESDREAALNCVDVLWEAASAPADSVTAPAGGVVAGPSKWTDEEIADGKRGIRWVTEGVIHGRPTDHDVREYLMRTPAMRGCLCDDCRTFYAPTPPAQAADPLQGAADWLAEAHGQFCVAVLQGCLMIGYNRAKRLHDAAIAARKQGVA